MARSLQFECRLEHRKHSRAMGDLRRKGGTGFRCRAAALRSLRLNCFPIPIIILPSNRLVISSENVTAPVTTCSCFVTGQTSKILNFYNGCYDVTAPEGVRPTPLSDLNHNHDRNLNL